MPRRKSGKRPWGGPHRELDEGTVRGIRHSEVGPDGRSYQVQYVGPAQKTYRCPGCNQQVEVGTRHTVVWAEDSLLGWDSGVESRRHWHRACWNRRLRAQ